MSQKRSKLCLTILFGLGMLKIQAQQVSAASGGDASGSGGSVNYSIGQIFYTTNSGATGTVAQGVQQPYEISTVTAANDPEVKISLSVFPNPTADLLILNTLQNNTDGLVYQIFDINGKLLESKSLTGNETKIAMSSFSAATYFLKVIREDKLIRTFKIIKN